MKTIQFNTINLYKNAGHNAEYAVGQFFGIEATPNNIPHTAGGDVLNYQVKSARATVCKGTDIDAYLAIDGATEYIYVTNTFKGYVMNRDEWKEFVNRFGTITRESKQNGGAEKIRLKSESREMLEYLAEA